MTVGECVVLDPDRLIEFYGADNDELHLAFNFHFLRAPWGAESFRERTEIFEKVLPNGAWPDYTLSNHDNPRAVSRYASGDIRRGRRRGRLAALMLLTLRGTPFIYYGEEIGMADAPIPPKRVVDVAGRDPERTPMQWDASPGAGFTTGDPWLPVNPETATVNIEAQRRDPASMLSLYRRLIAERRASPALRRGTYRTLPAPKDVFAYARELDGEQRVVLLNLAERAVQVPVARLGIAPEGLRVTQSTGPERGSELLGKTIELAPEEGVLLDEDGT
jgi:alpha-glucosidase